MPESFPARRPLNGRRVVVTRAAPQAGPLVRLLEEAGARVVLFPTIAVEALDDTSHLDRAAASMSDYRWVVFTSANGVSAFFEALSRVGLDASAFDGRRVAAIGPATASALAARGVAVDRVPAHHVAEGLAEVLAGADLDGARLLLPRAETARDALPEALRSFGARVDVVPAYRTVLPEADTGLLRRALAGREIDALTFTSSSTVNHFAELFGRGEAERLTRASGAVVACIGPITAASALDAGLRVDVVAERFTGRGLVDALVRYYTAA